MGTVTGKISIAILTYYALSRTIPYLISLIEFQVRHNAEFVRGFSREFCS